MSALKFCQRIILFIFIFYTCFGAAKAQARKQLSSLELLKDLISINTTNPPGNETQAARYVQKYLNQFDIPSKLIESEPGRGNLIARLKGSGQKKSLILLAHLDVVMANPKAWKHPPFKATEDGEYLFGRGAIDMKGMAALMIHSFVQLKLQNIALAGDVLLVLVADEEAGGKYGAEYLVNNYWEELDPGVVFNEGSIGVIREGMHLYPIQVAEKGVAWMELTATGTSGHGSIPIKDNATVKLIRALNNLREYESPIQKTEIVEEILNRMSSQYDFPTSWLLKHFFDFPIRQLAPWLAGNKIKENKLLNAKLKNTIVPTVLKAGSKINVIPAKATALVDCRILPGETPQGFLEKIKKIIDDPEIKVKLLTESLPNQSDFKTPYFEALEQVIKKQDPKAIVIPYMSSGATDNRFFREKGALAYGIIPLLVPMKDLAGLHGKNEKIPIKELKRGEKIIWDFILQVQAEKAKN